MSSCYLATMVDNLADKVNECLLIGVVASLSEPHTSKLNGGFFIYIYISAVCTSFRKCKFTLAHRSKKKTSKNKDDTLRYSSLEESYFSALTQSFTFSVLGYRLF